jgi:hypothetical protein
MNKFKLGVSNWELTIDGKIILVNSVIEEVIKFTAERGTPIITLKNAAIHTELVDLLQEGKNVDHIKQIFKVVDGNSGSTSNQSDLKEIVWEYDFLQIKTLELKTKIDNFAVFNIKLK